jgi:hypothetical protein
MAEGRQVEDDPWAQARDRTLSGRPVGQVYPRPLPERKARRARLPRHTEDLVAAHVEQFGEVATGEAVDTGDDRST